MTQNADTSKFADRCRNTRQSALERSVSAWTADHEETARKLREQVAAAEKQLAAKCAEARKREHDAYLKLHAEFTADFYAEAVPLVERFREEGGRATARAIVDLIERFVAREDEELGPRPGLASRVPELLAFTFVNEVMEKHPASVAVFGSSAARERFGNEAWGAMRARNILGDFVLALERLDAKVESIAHSNTIAVPEPWVQERYKVARLVEPEAIEAFDQERERKRKEAAGGVEQTERKSLPAPAPVGPGLPARALFLR